MSYKYLICVLLYSGIRKSCQKQGLLQAIPSKIQEKERWVKEVMKRGGMGKDGWLGGEMHVGSC